MGQEEGGGRVVIGKGRHENMGQRGGEDRVQVLWTLDSSQRGLEEVLGDNGSTGRYRTVPTVYLSQVPVLLLLYPWAIVHKYVHCTVPQYRYRYQCIKLLNFKQNGSYR